MIQEPSGWHTLPPQPGLIQAASVRLDNMAKHLISSDMTLATSPSAVAKVKADQRKGKRKAGISTTPPPNGKSTALQMALISFARLVLKRRIFRPEKLWLGFVHVSIKYIY